MSIRPKRLSNMPQLWIAAVLVIGVFYLLLLQARIPDGAYFSGDSGLKAMLSQELAAGTMQFSLDNPALPWINDLWEAGMCPYHEPYVYHLAGKYYITFPYTFSLVTAPLYAWIGYRGLYVIPWLATLITWLIFYWACRKLNLSAAATAVGLAFLIFASNLTIFSAMYWEHTLSVCLAFAGFALAMPANGTPRVSLWAAAWAGVFSGLAVWFRPEQIFLVLFLGFVAFYGLLKAHLAPQRLRWPAPDWMPDYFGTAGWAYLTASLGALLAYGLTNWLIYQNFLGVHAIQVIEHQAPVERVLASLGNLQLMTTGHYSLFAYLPIALFPLAYAGAAWFRPGLAPYQRQWTALYTFCLAFVLGAAVLVPAGAGGKQWGPRFLLLLAPVIVLLFTWQIDSLIKNAGMPRQARGWAALAVLVLGAFGILQNPVRGVDFLTQTYVQIQPAVSLLRAEPGAVIAISDQFIGQVLLPALSRDTAVVQVSNADQLGRLSAALAEHDRDTFTYICFSHDCRLFEQVENPLRVEQGGRWYQLQTESSGEYGKYSIFHIRIYPEN